MRIIDDGNWEEMIAESVAAHGGKPGALPRQTAIGGLWCASRVFAEDVPLIPESQWKDRIAAKQGKWIRQKWERQKPKIKYQNGLRYCWAYSISQCCEALRAKSNQPYVELGPESLGGMVDFENAGGCMDTAIQYAADHGIACRAMIPEHCLDSTDFAVGWEQNALKHAPTEWWDLGAKDVWAETVSALLADFPIYVGLDWWGHAVMYDELQIIDGEICAHSPNTHGEGQDVILRGSQKIPSMGSFVPRVITFSMGG